MPQSQILAQDLSNFPCVICEKAVGCNAPSVWFKHILLARIVDIIKQMFTILKLQGLEWKQHAYIIPFRAFAAIAVTSGITRDVWVCQNKYTVV